jgi:hypothetical protein
MYIRRLKKSVLSIAIVSVAACAGDSTGPGTVGADEALQSLARGFDAASGIPLPFAFSLSALGTAATGLGQANVTIGGREHSMYALGLRVTYPTGTCFESLVSNHPSFAPPPGQCTSPPLGLVLALWQTTSASRRPDRMVFIAADAGTSNFSFLSALVNDVSLPAFAFYIDNREEFWGSIGGTLSSEVTATSATCAVPPPPFAKTSTCHVASFDESGRITFERFDIRALGAPGVGAVRETTEMVIPRQTILGILQAITETQPIVFSPWDY